MRKPIVLLIQSCSWTLINRQWDFIQNKYPNSEFWLFTTQTISDDRFKRVISIPLTKRLNPIKHLLAITKLNLKHKFQAVICLCADTYGVDYSNVRILINMIRAHEKKVLNNKREWIDISNKSKLLWDIIEEIQFIYPSLFLGSLKVVLRGKRLFDRYIQKEMASQHSLKKITFLTGALVSGGVEVLLLTMVRKFQDRGYQVQLISVSGGRLVYDFRKTNCLLHICHEEITEDISSLRYIGWYIKRLKEFKPDILMVFQFRPFLPGLIAGIFAGIPVIFKSENVSSDIAGQFIERQMMVLEELFNRVIAVSEAVKRRLYWLKDNQCSVIIGTNVEVETFVHLELAQISSQRKIRFLTVARLAPEKGIQYLLEAAAKVVAKGYQVHFSIVGEGKLLEQLVNMRDILGLKEHVEFLGYRKDIPDLLGECDIFVLPSLIEGLPLVIMEAMMAGRCIIATSVDGTPEIIEHMTDGILIEPKDTERLAAAMEMLIQSPEMITKLGRAARCKAQIQLSANHMMDRLEELFQFEWSNRG